MKRAVISDVRSNLPGLEAVLADIVERDEVGAVYHLGDLVGYAPWPNEVVALIRERRIPGIVGNYDSAVANDYKHCGCRADSARRGALARKLRLDPRARRARDQEGARGGALQDGPACTGRPHLPAPDHARARRPDPEHPLLDRGPPRLFLREYGESGGPQGGRPDRLRAHPYKPWTREVEGVRFVNTGSVGKPKDGDWRACHVLAEVGEGLGPVEHVRVEYGLERAVDGIRRCELPDEFADQLRAGGTPKPVEVP